MSTSSPLSTATNRRPWWPWVMLGLGLVWTILIRIPLILNAEDHLDSDLAVDGLTLLDAVHGHWRWHYPGTPYMGILPMFSSYLQALVWGANPITLVSGGTLIWVLVVASPFWLAWRAFGPSVAGWSIVPLVFSSLGTIWLSGRITGGHLLTLVWHTVAFVGLHACLTRGGWKRCAAMGFWCGLGIYLDAMFLFTIAGLVPAALLAWLRSGSPRSGFASAAMFLAGMMAGSVPREIGTRVDPYDAYPSQFETTFEPPALLGHTRLLILNCIPRLIAGPELSDFQRNFFEADSPFGAFLVHHSGARTSWKLPRAREWASILILVGFTAAMVRVLVESARRGDPARQAVGLGTTLSALLIVAAFLVNRNIFNSDNYRYLIFLLIPWALGFGLVIRDMAQRDATGRLAACLIAGLLAVMMTTTTFYWYRDTRHYLDTRGIPVRTSLSSWSDLSIRTPAREGRPLGPLRPPFDKTTRFEIPSDVTHILGGYWDVYRISFLSERRVMGIPFPMYPNRFPGWSEGLGADRGKLLILRPGEDSTSVMQWAAETPGSRPPIIRSARRIDWRPGFSTVWKADGRNPAEIDHLQVVVP
jgi:hypothetical protein